MELELHKATTQIVAAYLGRNEIRSDALPVLISQIFVTLQRLTSPVEEPAAQTPAVPVKKSVTRDHITCLECGQKAKMLKRHLQVQHEMSPAEYRDKWNLPGDYPMTAPGYAKVRADLARAIRLGSRTRAKVIPINGANAK